MANSKRGEIDITLGGREYTLRPTFEAMVEFEDKAGRSAYDIMQDLANQRVPPFKVIAAGLHAGIKAGFGHGRPPSFNEVGEMVRKDGIPAVLGGFTQFLMNALTTEEDRAAAAAGKAQETSPPAP